jgi:hypothetical protein
LTLLKKESLEINFYYIELTSSLPPADVVDWDGYIRTNGVRKRSVISLIVSSSCYEIIKINFLIYFYRISTWIIRSLSSIAWRYSSILTFEVPWSC